MLMKFAPTAAFQVNDWLSLGAALNIDYSTMDLGRGNGANFGIGGQFGIIVKPHEQISLGLTYITPQPVNYRNVFDFDGDGRWDNLILESPTTLGFGMPTNPFTGKLLFEVDVKWLNWSNAKGYSDFGWHDQIVVGSGPIQADSETGLESGLQLWQNP
jgi:long-chain fatty acid transport protein